MVTTETSGFKNATTGLNGDRNKRTSGTDLDSGSPVKSTFPYRSWICGARPSLNRYRLREDGKAINKRNRTQRYTRTGTQKGFFCLNTC